MNNRYLKIYGFNGYVRGQRSSGRPKKRWLDVVVEDCKESIHEATRLVDGGEGWRRFVEELLLRMHRHKSSKSSKSIIII